MYKKKPLFITFEGIEGSGKSYQSKKLYKYLKKNKINSILTREPGGTFRAEKIRKIILEDYFNSNSKEKYDKYTDTLLYLAARNEHIINKIKPAIAKKQVVLCDRFVDSTIAYQVYGKLVNKNFVNRIFDKNETKKCNNQMNKANCYAKRFAAKEAFSKALGTGIRKGISLKNIEISNNSKGKPYILLRGDLSKFLKKKIKNKKYDIHLSLSDDKPWAQATVIISHNK